MITTNKINELAELYITREILCRDSTLISYLLSSYSREHETNNAVDAFSYDNITNAYDYSKEAIEQFLCYEADKDIIKELLVNYDGGVTSLNLDNYTDILTLDELKEIAEKCNYDAEPQEIFEWYRVTEWLAKELETLGEPILHNTHGYWWGRTCCGQMIIADGTIQQIAKKYI